jgi:anti-anti-sigma factor
MDESLKITAVQGSGGNIVLSLKGRIDGHSTPLLMERCSAALNAGLHLILNLSQVSFVSSSGIGAFLALSEDFRERGTSLRLAGMSKPVHLAITLLNLEDFLLIDENEEAAVRALAEYGSKAA